MLDRIVAATAVYLGDGPLAGELAEAGFVFGPVVEGCGVEVGSVGPDERVDFGVYFDLLEEVQVSEGTVELTTQDRLEVDGLHGAFIEIDIEYVPGLESQSADAMDCVLHVPNP